MDTRLDSLRGAFQPLLAAVHRMRGPLALFLLIVCAFWRLVLTNQYSWLNGMDLSNQVMPWMQFQAGEWHAGRIPLWSPYEWGGQSLIGQGQPGVMNPLNWILFWLPLRRGWLRESVLNWWFVCLHYIAALNLYWLARSFGAGRIAAIFGGLIFGLLGFMGSIDWPQMICGVIWAPLVFLFVFRAHRGVQPWLDCAWAGFFLGLCWLSGHHQLPIFVSLATAGLCIYLQIWRAVWLYFVAGLVGAVQLLPGLEYGRIARRWVGMQDTVGWKDSVAYYVHEQYSNQPAALFGIVLPGYDTHTSLYLGITALALAGWAVYALWERREVRAFLFVGIGALLFVMGRRGLLHPLLYSLVPMVEKARSPNMAGALFTLSFAVLAALAVDHSKFNTRPNLFFAGGVGALFALGLLFPRSESQFDERWLAAAFVSGLVALAGWSFSQGRLSARSLRIVLLMAVMIESANMTYYNWGNRHDPNVTHLLPGMSQHQDVREYLSTLPQPIRITVDDKAIPFNFGDWHGVEVMGGYLASLSTNIKDADWFSPRTRPVAGVGYHVGPTPPNDEAKLIFAGSQGANVYAYPETPFPRAWLSHAVLRYQNLEQYHQFINNSSLNLREVALTQSAAPNLESCAPGEALVLRHDPGRVLLRAEANCRGLLTLADTDDSGWKVSVDGRPAQKLSVFHSFRGVVLEKGSHSVEWVYQPMSVILGGVLSFLGCLIPVAQSLLAPKLMAQSLLAKRR
jgi:hypothetical protein